MATIGHVTTADIETVIEWKINNFIGLSARSDKSYLSPTFSFHNVSWYLSIKTNRFCEKNSVEFIDLYLHRKSHGQPISLEYYLGLKTHNGKIEKEKCCRCTFEYTEAENGFGYPKFLTRCELIDKMNQFAPDNCLTVICKLKYLKPNEVAGPIFNNNIMHFTKPLNDGVTTQRSNSQFKCSYCKKVLGTDVAVRSHEDKCLDKSIKCPECHRIVALRKLYNHICKERRREGPVFNHNMMHFTKCLTNGVTTQSNSQSKCSYCQKTFEADVDVLSHENKCLDKPVKCPECDCVITLRKLDNHKCKEKRKEGCKSTSSDPVSFSGAKVLADLKELFLMQEGCDVTIKVKDQEFQAHKTILRARSSVFASTFRHDMKEKKIGIIEIDDCDPSSFPDFLSFLYCGNVEKLSTENAFSLFVTADKYDVQDLRLQCLDFLKNNLLPNTFCKTVTMALQYTEKELLQVCIDFLANNLQKVIMTVEWQSLLTENPIQCNELIIKALNAYPEK